MLVEGYLFLASSFVTSPHGITASRVTSPHGRVTSPHGTTRNGVWVSPSVTSPHGINQGGNRSDSAGLSSHVRSTRRLWSLAGRAMRQQVCSSGDRFGAVRSSSARED